MHEFKNNKYTRLEYPLALWSWLYTSQISTRNPTRRNLPTYLQNFNWVLQRQRISERYDEKEYRTQFSKRGKMAVKCLTWRVGVSTRAAHALSVLSCQVSAFLFPQSCNLGGMSMNIQRKNSAYHFHMQSEREQTLVTGTKILTDH